LSPGVAPSPVAGARSKSPAGFSVTAQQATLMTPAQRPRMPWVEASAPGKYDFRDFYWACF